MRPKSLSKDSNPLDHKDEFYYHTRISKLELHQLFADQKDRKEFLISVYQLIEKSQHEHVFVNEKSFQLIQQVAVSIAQRTYAKCSLSLFSPNLGFVLVSTPCQMCSLRSAICWLQRVRV